MLARREGRTGELLRNRRSAPHKFQDDDASDKISKIWK